MIAPSPILSAAEPAWWWRTLLSYVNLGQA
jgi:hypothetical protein